MAHKLAHRVAHRVAHGLANGLGPRVCPHLATCRLHFSRTHYIYLLFYKLRGEKLNYKSVAKVI